VTDSVSAHQYYSHCMLSVHDREAACTAVTDGWYLCFKLCAI